MAIRWGAGEFDVFLKEIERYNRRIREYNKRMGYDQPIYLPNGTVITRAIPTIQKPKATLRGLVSRSEINRFKREMAKMTETIKPKRKNVEMATTRGGITIPKAEKLDIERRVRAINRERAKRNALIRAKMGNVFEGNRVAMGMLAQSETRPKRALSTVSREGYEAYKQSVLKQSAPGYWSWRDQRLRDGYMKAVKNELGDDAYNEINKLTKILSNEDFMLLVVTDEDLEFNFVYGQQAKATKSKLITAAWKAALGVK